MRARRGTTRTWLARSAFVAVFAVACAGAFVGARGGGDDGSLFQNGTGDGGAGDDGSGPDLDATFAGDGSTGDGTTGNCTPKKCTDLGYTCGKDLDGCGSIIDCGT